MTWHPSAQLDVLRYRSETLRLIRKFFEKHHFCEVQTPVLCRDTVVDRHLDPIEVPAESLGLNKPDAEQTNFYLQTSPEFSMKRLLAAGMEAIYQIGPAFRAAEQGPMHNPEFTMVEWYRQGDEMEEAMEFLSSMMLDIGPWQRVEQLSYRQAFLRFADCDPLSASISQLAVVGTQHADVRTDWSQDRDDWLNLIFATCVQPNLGLDHPTLVFRYPASQSALAKLTPTQDAAASQGGGTAERFELFIDGVELANGYHELTDARELRQRNETVNQQRMLDGKAALPVESRLLKAMQAGLPNSSGCALGLDRLLMVLQGFQNIDAVQAFPWERC